MEKASSVGAEMTSSGTQKLVARRVVAIAISYVVTPSCLIAPSMVALISAYP